MSFRKVLLFLHLWAALIAGVSLLLLGVTGSFMVYENEIDHLLNRRLVAVQPAGQPLPLSELFARLEKAHPGYKVTDLRMRFPENRTPLGRSRVLLDPYTGRALSVWSTRTAPVGFKISRMWIREIHTGDIFGWPTRLLACLVSLALPILAITGTLIWWNRSRKLVPADAEEAD